MISNFIFDEKTIKQFKKSFQKHPDAFWLDLILILFGGSVNGKIAFSEKTVINYFNIIVNKSKGSVYYKQEKVALYLTYLLNEGHIVMKSEESYAVTNSGVAFSLFKGGHVERARNEEKKKNKVELENFKIGYELIISTVALIISLISLFLSIN